MPHPDSEPSLGDRMRRLEALLQEIDATADPAQLARTQEIVQTILDFHGAGLTRIIQGLHEAGPAGRSIWAELAADALVRDVLLLYDLHPEGLEARVRAALEQVRPLLATHGGSVELVDCSDQGEIRLRLTGNCHGCPSSQQTLRQTIEQALYAAAPDVTALIVDGALGSSEQSGSHRLTAPPDADRNEKAGFASSAQAPAFVPLSALAMPRS